MKSPADEARRLAALASYAVLDTPPESAFDELTRLAANICDVPTAVITLVDANRQWFKSRFGFETAQTERSISFCTHTIESANALVIPDALADPRFATNPLVVGPPHIRFYAGAPLVMPSSDVLGTLAVIDYVPRELPPAKLDALVALAHQVVSQLELRRLLAEQHQLRREGAERFELVARATNDAVWDWDLVTNQVWWNEGLRNLFGLTPEQVPTADMWLAAIHADDVQRVSDGIHAAIHRGDQAWSDTYRFRRLDDTYADIFDRGYVIKDASGKPIRMIGAMIDITERRRLEDQLRQAQKMDALGQLSGGIAHDFNNLLTVIQVNAALLARASADSQLRVHTDEIRDATERAAALTRQLLMVSRKQVMQPRVIDINAVVSQLTRMLHRIVGEDITLVAELAPDLPPLSADVSMLEQVVLNLVVNARDAMPKGGNLTILTGHTLVVEPKDMLGLEVSAGPYVWVSVTDSGGGIAPDVLPHIFEPFFTTKDIGRGTGLGLATAYGIVRQHHGWIEATSELGHGTTVRFYLPATTQSSAHPSTTRPVEDDLPTGTETILVVEDEAALRNLVVDFLESCGYNALHASSGVVALEVWNEHRAEIQLVLTDVIMPGGISGRDLAERVRADVADVPVVYTSGYSPDLVGSGELLIAGENYVQKPYDPAVLARAIRTSLDKRRA